MAAKIGILGEDTSITDDTTVTVYTVPADKAARVQVRFMCAQSASFEYLVRIGSPGTEITINSQMGGGIDFWTGRLPASSPDPALSSNAPPGLMQKNDGLGNMDVDGASAAEIFSEPLATTYFLSTGDTVKFRISTADLEDHLIQVVGVEDDA